MTDTAIPTVKEELCRKTVDVLLELESRSLDGRLAANEHKRTARVIWTLTAGLVDDETLKLCGQAADGCKDDLITLRYLGKGALIEIRYWPQKSGFVATTRNATTQERSVLIQSTAEVGLREGKILQLTEGLLKRGYVKIS